MWFAWRAFLVNLGVLEVRSEQYSFSACCTSQDHVGNACYTESHGKGLHFDLLM